MEYNVRAIALSRTQAGERDVLVTYFTHERGRMQAMVRGTTKTVSSLRPAAQPLNEGDALIVERRGADLLTEWVPVTSFPGVTRRLRSLCLAAYLLRFTRELTNLRQPEPALYNLLKITLSALQNNEFYDIMKLTFEWGYLRISGLAFDLSQCSECGRKRQAKDRAALDIPGGGVYCPRCAPGAKAAGTMVLCLDAVELGNMIDEVISRVSGDVLAGEEQTTSYLRNLQRLHQHNGKTGGVAAAQFQSAVSRFIQFHLNESAPSWHARV